MKMYVFKIYDSKINSNITLNNYFLIIPFYTVNDNEVEVNFYFIDASKFFTKTKSDELMV